MRTKKSERKINHYQLDSIYFLGLFKITKAAITPGTHPQSHNKKTIIIEPQPLSRTASGGQKIERRTLQILIILMIYNHHYHCVADCYIYLRRKTIQFVTELELLCQLLE